MNIELARSKEIRIAIIKVIAFFDLFDYPLTEFEIWKFLKIKASLWELVYIINNSELSRISKKNGFYFLAGRESIVETRMRRNDYTCDKLKRANRVARIFRHIKSIKMIAVGGMFGGFNLKKDGDIDFFILVKKGTIWRTRFLCVMIIKLLNLRPQKDNKKDKICLSFFISTDYSDTEKLRLDNDVCFDNWLIGHFPIYNIDYIYEKFISQNKWIKREFPNWKMIKNNTRFLTLPTNNIITRFFIMILFLPGEFFFKKIQFIKFPDEIRNKMNKNTDVVVKDNILKLHTTDNRRYYRQKYIDKLYEIFAKNN